MISGQIAVEQMNAVEIRGVGDPADFRGHGLVLGFNHQALIRIVGACGRLFRQFLHPDQLFVDDAEGAVSGLDQGDGIVGVPDSLAQGRDFRPHEFADGKAGGIVSGGTDPQAGRQTAYRGGKVVVGAAQVAGGGHCH